MQYMVSYLQTNYPPPQPANPSQMPLTLRQHAAISATPTTLTHHTSLGGYYISTETLMLAPTLEETNVSTIVGTECEKCSSGYTSRKGSYSCDSWSAIIKFPRTNQLRFAIPIHPSYVVLLYPPPPPPPPRTAPSTEGYYMSDSGCRRCPEGARCSEFTTLQTLGIERGQFRFSESTAKIYSWCVDNFCMASRSSVKS